MREVLFVDDSVGYLDSIVPFLSPFLKNFKSVKPHLRFSVEDTEEYIEEADAAPELAIVDLWMKDEKTNSTDQQAGIKAITVLRQKWPELPVFVLSNHGDAKARLELERFGNIAIFTKRIPTDELQELIDIAI